MQLLDRVASRLHTSCNIREACQCMASIMVLAINRLVLPKIQDACLWGNKDALHEAPVAAVGCWEALAVSLWYREWGAERQQANQPCVREA